MTDTKKPSQDAIFRWCKARVNIGAAKAVINGHVKQIRKAFVVHRTAQGELYWLSILRGEKPLSQAAKGRIREAIKVAEWIEGGCVND